MDGILGTGLEREETGTELGRIDWDLDDLDGGQMEGTGRGRE